MGLKYHVVVVAAVCALTSAGCGPKAAAGPTTSATAAGGSGSGIPVACLDEKTIGAALGFAVHAERATIKQSAEAVNCTFLADDQANRPGANASVLVAPASYAAQAFADISDSAGRAHVAVSPVPVGQQGIAYESSQRTAVATIIGGKLVAVTIDGMGLSSAGAGTTVAIDIVRKVAATQGA